MLGIYYFDYCKTQFPKSAREMIIAYTRTDLLDKIAAVDIPLDWFCWLSECRTPGYLVEGKTDWVMEWIELHMPEQYGDPLRNME